MSWTYRQVAGSQLVYACHTRDGGASLIAEATHDLQPVKRMNYATEPSMIDQPFRVVIVYYPAQGNGPSMLSLAASTRTVPRRGGMSQIARHTNVSECGNVILSRFGCERDELSR